MVLITLAYVSFATHPMTEDELKALLEECRSHNEKVNITGMLLYRDGFFIQALEGERDDVEALYKKIRQDSRHRNIITVYKNEIERRVFTDWTMGFNNLDEIDPRNVPGFSDFLTEPADEVLFAADAPRTRALLESFANHKHA